MYWRRGWDSNPRYSYPHTSLAGRRLQPLGHPSIWAGRDHVRFTIDCQETVLFPLSSADKFLEDTGTIEFACYTRRLSMDYRINRTVFRFFKKKLELVFFCTLLFLHQAAPLAGQDDQRTWSGEINLGGSLATGNTDRTAFDATLKAQFRTEHLEDRYLLSVEFADENGATTAQRILTAIESRVDFTEDNYFFGYLEYDDDRFSGFSYEINAAVGTGFRSDFSFGLLISAQLGPGFRLSKRQDTNQSESQETIRGSIGLEHSLSKNALITDDLVVTWDKDRFKVENTFALTSKLLDNLSSRVSFNIRHNDSPPFGTKSTDTLTRISIIYEF